MPACLLPPFAPKNVAEYHSWASRASIHHAPVQNRSPGLSQLSLPCQLYNTPRCRTGFLIGFNLAPVFVWMMSAVIYVLHRDSSCSQRQYVFNVPYPLLSFILYWLDSRTSYINDLLLMTFILYLLDPRRSYINDAMIASRSTLTPAHSGCSGSVVHTHEGTIAKESGHSCGTSLFIFRRSTTFFEVH